MPVNDVLADVRMLSAATASLNDAVSELVAGLASGDTPTKGWAYTVVTALAEHSRKLGFLPNVDEESVAGWKDEP